LGIKGFDHDDVTSRIGPPPGLLHSIGRRHVRIDVHPRQDSVNPELDALDAIIVDGGGRDQNLLVFQHFLTDPRA